MSDKKGPSLSPAFLLAQVGAHAAAKFAERLAPLGLSPPHAGILRVLGSSPGPSQQQLATILGIHPSRLVAILDDLEAKGLVERTIEAGDRRSHAIHLTEKGSGTLRDIGRVAREHNIALLAPLTPSQQEELARFLQAIASDQGLKPGVHPGYGRLGPVPRAPSHPSKEGSS